MQSTNLGKEGFRIYGIRHAGKGPTHLPCAIMEAQEMPPLPALAFKFPETEDPLFAGIDYPSSFHLPELGKGQCRIRHQILMSPRQALLSLQSRKTMSVNILMAKKKKKVKKAMKKKARKAAKKRVVKPKPAPAPAPAPAPETTPAPSTTPAAAEGTSPPPSTW